VRFRSYATCIVTTGYTSEQPFLSAQIRTAPRKQTGSKPVPDHS